MGARLSQRVEASMLEEFEGKTPQLAPGSWVHPSAVLIGDVWLAEGASVWPTAVLRGDMGAIRIGHDSNVQDGAICHDTTNLSETIVGDRVTVGHRAVLHGCIVHDDCLIGMGAMVLDNAVIGAGSFVAAGALVPPGREIPPGSFVMGMPGRVLRQVGSREREAIALGWQSYKSKLRQWRNDG